MPKPEVDAFYARVALEVHDGEFGPLLARLRDQEECIANLTLLIASQSECLSNLISNLFYIFSSS